MDIIEIGPIYFTGTLTKITENNEGIIDVDTLYEKNLEEEGLNPHSFMIGLPENTSYKVGDRLGLQLIKLTPSKMDTVKIER